MKKIILTIDDNDNLVDDNGLIIYCAVSVMNWEYKEAGPEFDAAEMLKNGMTIDDVIKLRMAELIFTN